MDTLKFCRPRERAAQHHFIPANLQRRGDIEPLERGVNPPSQRMAAVHALSVHADAELVGRFQHKLDWPRRQLIDFKPEAS